MRRALVVIAALLLAVPAAAATPGLDRVSDKDISVSVTGSQVAVVATDYTLQLPSSMKLQLITSGPAGHSAQWSIDGTIVGETDGQNRLDTDVLQQGGHAVEVRWSLGSSVPAGDHPLDVYVRQTADSGSGGQGFAGDHERVNLHLERTTAGGGGGGGSSGSGSSGEGSSGSTSGSSTSGSTGDTGTGSGTGSGTPPSDGAGSSFAPGTAVPVAALAVLRSAGIDIEDGALRFVDIDGDGIPDAVLGGPDHLVVRHRVLSQALFVLQDQTSGAAFLLDSRQGTAARMALLDGVYDAPAADASSVEVTVADKQGWILVTIDDPFPDRDLAGLSRGNTDLPTDFMWREGSKLHFIDDPETVYTVHFAAADDDLDDDGAGASGQGFSALPATFVWGAAVFLAGTAMIALALMVRRRR